VSTPFCCRVCGEPSSVLARRPRGEVVELLFLHAGRPPCLLVAEPDNALALTVEAIRVSLERRRSFELVDLLPPVPRAPARVFPLANGSRIFLSGETGRDRIRAP